MAGVAFATVAGACSGALIALLNFAAQVKTIRPQAMPPLVLAILLLGMGLAFVAWSSLAGYASESRFANGLKNRWYWVAIYLGLGALLCLTVGLIASGVMLWRQLL
jgi:hypothetical protein